MSASTDRDPQTIAGPEPQRRTYDDGAYGSEEQTAQPDGSENVGANYAPGTVRTGGNIIWGVVALAVLAALVIGYLLLVAR